MAITRDLNNVNKLTDWTDEINEIDNQFGFVKSQGYFTNRPTSQTSIVFDRNINDITLLPQVNRRSHNSTYGKDRVVETYALALPYFKHSDFITVEDIQGQRRPGQPDTEETLAQVRADKLEDLRLAMDQTHEYLMIQALKGETKDPSGTTIANMYTEFSLNKAADFTVDFLLATATTDLDIKFNDVKRRISSGLKSGSRIQGIDMLVSPEWFDKLITHPKFREVYQSYVNSGVQRLRDDLSEYMSWGVLDFVEHRGVRIMAYDATFKLPDGTTENAFAVDTGIAIPRGARDVFRGYFGPSNKLTMANEGGREMFAYEYRDQEDENHTMQVESAPLFFASKPASIIHLATN